MAKLKKNNLVTKYNDASIGIYRSGQSDASITEVDHQIQISDLTDSMVFDFIVSLASTQNYTISGSIIVDGFLVGDGQYVLFKDQTTTSENGVYLLSSGIWTLFAQVSDFSLIYVKFGAVNGSKIFNINQNNEILNSFYNQYYDLVQNLIPGGYKVFVKAATTGALPSNNISGLKLVKSSPGAFPSSIDGVITNLHDYFLVKDEASHAKNGIYELTTEGSVFAAWELTRRSDVDSSSELNNCFTFVSNGSVNARKIFRQIKTITTLGTDAIEFEQFNSDGGVFSRSLVTSAIITLDFKLLKDVIFVGGDISETKTWFLSGDLNAIRFCVFFNMTTTDTQSFDGNFIMQSVGGWNSSTNSWTPFSTGKYKLEGKFDGTDWWLDMFGPY